MTMDLHINTEELTPPNFARGNFSDHEDIASVDSHALYDAARPIARRTLLDLPTELRLMIAKHALYCPQSLSWFWMNYRKGARIATLRWRGTYNEDLDLENLTALKRTCNLLYEEARGLSLSVNDLTFSLYTMPHRRVPDRCKDMKGGSHQELTAVSEAISSKQVFLPYNLQASLKCLRFQLLMVGELRDHWNQFKDFVAAMWHVRIMVTISTLALYPLDEFDLQRVKDLQDEAEPHQSEQEQTRERVEQYFSTGRQLSALVTGISTGDRNQRVYRVRYIISSKKRFAYIFPTRSGTWCKPGRWMASRH
jgi:hypothetical protein